MSSNCMDLPWELDGSECFYGVSRSLPSYARDVADEECKAGLAYVEDTFKEAISVWQEWTAAAAADKASVRPFNIKQFNVACTRLDRNHLQLKRSLPPETRANFANLIWWAITREYTTLKLKCRWMRTLKAVLNPPMVSLRPLIDIPFEEVIRLIEDYNISDGDAPRLHPGKARSEPMSTILTLASTLRFYWPSSVAEKVMRYCKGDLEKVDSVDMFRASIILHALYPHQSDTIVEDMTEWLRMLRKVDHSRDWDSLFISLLSRANATLKLRSVIFGDQQLFDWGPYLLEMFSRIKRLLNLPFQLLKDVRLTKQYPQGPMWGWVKKDVKAADAMLVELLGTNISPSSGANNEDGISDAMLLLRRLMRSMHTFFHPSNAGASSDSLALFLTRIVHAFITRLGSERAYKRHASSNNPDDLFMPTADKVAFIKDILPLVEMALYSKSPELQRAGNGAVRKLAWIAPRTILDKFLPMVTAALDPSNVNQSHQTPAAMKTIAALLQPCLQADVPHIAPHVPALLRLCILAIDPNEQMKTLVCGLMCQAAILWVPIIDTSEFEEQSVPQGLPIGGKSVLNVLDTMLEPQSALRTKFLDIKDAEKDHGVDEHLAKSPPMTMTEARNAMFRSVPAMAEWAMEILVRLLLLMTRGRGCDSGDGFSHRRHGAIHLQHVRTRAVRKDGTTCEIARAEEADRAPCRPLCAPWPRQGIFTGVFLLGSRPRGHARRGCRSLQGKGC